jgi:mannose-6-phosphate isomerase
VGDESVVANVFLKKNNIEEIVEVYMGNLVGEKNYERFGLTFPLLIKTLDCNDVLSIQVHPDDDLAAERHNSYGKTEVCYVSSCKPGAAIYVGFKDASLSREDYLRALNEDRLPEIMNRVEVKAGDVFFIPAGTIHALGKGVNVIEIQQTSDITYRIYDWDRVDASGKGRELHTALAVDAIDFEADAELLHKKYDVSKGGEAKVIECNYFTMLLHNINGSKVLDRSMLDSFVVYIALNGSVRIVADGEVETLDEGEVILIPAEISEITIDSIGSDAKLMEVYIDK